MHEERKYEPDTLIPGTIYRAIREIGSGGMGRVYEVEDTSISKHYALKVLRGAHASSPAQIARMKLESRTLVRVAHPNIVEVITAGVTSDGSFFYVMELLSGRSLRSLLKDAKRLSPSEALPIGIDVGDALVQAHEHGVVHRDVKPDNIFVARRHDVTAAAKLLDFGVAALLDNLRTTLRETGKLLGTPRYASPQQQLGEKAHASMDIWALGYVLFEAIVGHGPFRGRSLEEIIVAVQGPEPAFRLSDFVQDVPTRLDDLLASMLEKQVARRASSMHGVVQELRVILKSLEAAEMTRGPDESTVETVVGLVNRTSPSEPPLGQPREDQGVAERSAGSRSGDLPVTVTPPPFFADPPGTLSRASVGPSSPRGSHHPSSVVLAGEAAEGEQDQDVLDRAWGLLSIEAKAPRSKGIPELPDSSKRFFDPEPTPAPRRSESAGGADILARVRPAAGKLASNEMKSTVAAIAAAASELSGSGSVRTPPDASRWVRSVWVPWVAPIIAFSATVALGAALFAVLRARADHRPSDVVEPVPSANAIVSLSPARWAAPVALGELSLVDAAAEASLFADAQPEPARRWLENVARGADSPRPAARARATAKSAASAPPSEAEFDMLLNK